MESGFLGDDAVQGLEDNGLNGFDCVEDSPSVVFVERAAVTLQNAVRCQTDATFLKLTVTSVLAWITVPMIVNAFL